MRLTIIPSDKIVAVNGNSLRIDFEIDADVYAVQWDGESGQIEYLDSGIEDIVSIEQFQPIVDAWENERINILKLNPPSSYHTWNDAEKQWVIDSRGKLSQIVDGKKFLIKTTRKSQVDSGFYWETAGVHLDTDSGTRSALDTAASRIERIPERTYDWEKKDGSFIIIDQTNVHAIMDAVDNYIQPIFTAAKKAYDDIDAIARDDDRSISDRIQAIEVYEIKF